MKSNRRRRSIEWALALALLAGLPVVVQAAEGWAEIGWDGKWGSASIVYNRDATPTNPVDGGATFRNSIGPFHFLAWELTTPKYFDGYGGTMLTRNGLDPECDPMGDCSVVSLTIQLGPLSSGSPAQWEAHLFARGRLDPLGLPVLSEEDPPHFNGYLTNNLDDRRFGLGSGDYPYWHIRVAAPVPEPASLALMGLGVGMLAVRGRRWLQADRRAAPQPGWPAGT